MDAAGGAVEVAAESGARALELRPLVGRADPVNERRRCWLLHCGCTPGTCRIYPLVFPVEMARSPLLFVPFFYPVHFFIFFGTSTLE
jgi:hypothetical protein